MCLAGSQTRRAGSYWVVACMDYRLENRITAKMHKRRINKRIFALLAPLRGHFISILRTPL